MDSSSSSSSSFPSFYDGCPDAKEASALSARLACYVRKLERGMDGEPASEELVQETAPDGAANDLDRVLSTLKELIGHEGELGVVEAKAWLRAHGQRGRTAASRLSKLSQQRNRQSHPLRRQLLLEVRQLAKLGTGMEGAGRSDAPCVDGAPGQTVEEPKPFAEAPPLIEAKYGLFHFCFTSGRASARRRS